MISLQPLTAPPSLIPRPGFIRPLTPGLAASVFPTTSNSVVLSTVAYSTSSTAAIYTSAGSSGTVSTSSAVNYPQVNSTRPFRPFSVGPAASSTSTQTLVNLKSLIKRRTSLPPPYPRIVRTTATYIPPIGTPPIVDCLPLDLSVRPNLTAVPSGLPVIPQPLASLRVEVQPEPSSSTMPHRHRIPILQRPQSRLAALLSAGPSTRPTPSSTPVIEVLYPLYDEVEGNKK